MKPLWEAPNANLFRLGVILMEPFTRVSGDQACRSAFPTSRSHRHRLLAIAAAFTAAVLSLAPPATAATLPAYDLVGDLFFNLGPRLFLNDFGTTSLVDGRYGSVSLTASGTPSPVLTADTNIGPNLLAGISGRAAWVLNYAFEIEGPAGAVPVLIDVAGDATGFATTGASFAVESRWDLLFGGTSLAGDDIRSGQLTGSFDQSFSRTVSLTLTANRQYTVFMLADAFSGATAQGSRAVAHAFMDPVFSFGPGVDPLLYSFDFSAGIGNSPAGAAVPEPESLGLLGAGLLCLGFLRRRSRQPAIPGKHTGSLVGLVIGGLVITLGTSEAAPITVDLVPSTLTGAPGGILTFNGTLTNSSSSTVFLNSAGINITGPFSPSDLSTLPFFFNAPFFLDPGAATPAIDLFTVQLPVGLPAGPYLGQFTIQGGSDELALDVVGDVRFTAEAAADVPEPATFSLLAAAAILRILRSLAGGAKIGPQ